MLQYARRQIPLLNGSESLKGFVGPFLLKVEDNAVSLCTLRCTGEDKGDYFQVW